MLLEFIAKPFHRRLGCCANLEELKWLHLTEIQGLAFLTLRVLCQGHITQVTDEQKRKHIHIAPSVRLEPMPKLRQGCELNDLII